eukprot:snap_masked-scaffold383_size189472-processed-gene-0.14 protein:Tk11351 transcript:snap_masked-scaffold383_size189472-processed-gene-0.14-mRNA-1 annotation:"heme oxygenase 1-like"
MESKLFSQEMREATRSIHNMSDTLVNLKLGLAMSNADVWAEGLLVFYEIFRELEQAMEHHRDSLIGEFDIPGLRRTQAFEADLDFYLGPNWRQTYQIRPEVASYLTHLKQIQGENPYLLMAYIYHLYMGLLSGGQVLKGKQNFFSAGSKPSALGGNAVTEYGDQTITSLKKAIRDTANRVAPDLDEETRKAILEEGIRVFQLNNTIIKSTS